MPPLSPAAVLVHAAAAAPRHPAALLAGGAGFGSRPTPAWDLGADLGEMLSWAFMRNAFAAGTASALVAGVVGYFVVLRGSSFAAHAIAHIGFAGATGAVLIGLNPVLGVGVFSLASGAGMGVLGKRLHGRDAVIGLVMAFSLGLGSLFLALYKGNASDAYSVLFGQIFGISPAALWFTVATAALTLAAVAAVYRPLLFASLDEEVAQARGVPVGALAVGFMLLMALAVSEAVQVSGVLLIFALLIAPAAIAERVVRRPGRAIALSAALAVLITWLSLVLAYYTTPYPVSFYVTTLAFVFYLLARAGAAVRAAVRPVRAAVDGDAEPAAGGARRGTAAVAARRAPGG